MSDLSASDSENSNGYRSSFLETLAELPFPAYILADVTPRSRLTFFGHSAKGEVDTENTVVTDVTVTYLQYPNENVEPQILNITNSIEAESAASWPYTPIYHNEDLTRQMMDFVHLSFPTVEDKTLATVTFLRLIAEKAESEVHQTKSGLHFQVFHVDFPFPVYRAYMHLDNVSLHVIVIGVGYSHSEFIAALDLLIPAQGNEGVLRGQMSWSE